PLRKNTGSKSRFSPGIAHSGINPRRCGISMYSQEKPWNRIRQCPLTDSCHAIPAPAHRPTPRFFALPVRRRKPCGLLSNLTRPFAARSYRVGPVHVFVTDRYVILLTYANLGRRGGSPRTGGRDPT